MSDIVERLRAINYLIGDSHEADKCAEVCAEAADEIDRLRGLLMETRGPISSYIRKHQRAWEAALKRDDETHVKKHCAVMNAMLELEGRIEAALAESPAVQPSDALDAARYRWLRDVAHPDNGSGLCIASWETSNWGKSYMKHHSGKTLDDAIDAERAADNAMPQPAAAPYINPECLNDGVPCASDGAGGCVACDRDFTADNAAAGPTAARCFKCGHDAHDGPCVNVAPDNG